MFACVESMHKCVGLVDFMYGCMILFVHLVIIQYDKCPLIRVLYCSKQHRPGWGSHPHCSIQHAASTLPSPALQWVLFFCMIAYSSLMMLEVDIPWKLIKSFQSFSFILSDGQVRGFSVWYAMSVMLVDLERWKQNCFKDYHFTPNIIRCIKPYNPDYGTIT